MVKMIKTKLFVPPLRQELVARPQLKARLDEVQQRSFALISAPVGFGKTTLVTDWIRRNKGLDAGVHPFRVAWLSLEESDNDPVRFWRYVVAALQTAVPDLPEEVTALLEGRAPVTVDGVLTDLLNALSAVSVPIFFVIDDYHLIEEESIHNSIAFLLDHMPPRFHLIMTTRQDPPLSLARLRGQNLLVELRQEDLAFSEAEAAQFLNEVMGLSLTAEAVAILAARTEGWIAGLQMAALSMQGLDDVDGFLAAFTGSHRYIVDYLMDEVWQYQSPEIQYFLLQTAVLDELCAPLCEALIVADSGDETFTENDRQLSSSPLDCQAILETLERSNLFIIPLDDARLRYRYHHLFADLLRQRLVRMAPDRVPVLHELAGNWYEENGRFPEAIQHYLQGDDQQKAAALILEVAEAYLMRSEIDTLLDWLGVLSHETMGERPLLFVYLAGASLLAGIPLKTIERQMQEALAYSEGAATAEVNVLQGLIAAFHGDAAASETLSQAALHLLPEDNLFLRSLVVQNLALVQVVEGDVNRIIPDLLAAADVCAVAGNVMSQVICLAHAGELSIVAGQLLAAKGYYEQAIALAVDGLGRSLPIMGTAKMGLGEVYREWNELDKAAALSEEGLALIQRWGEVGQLEGYIWSARIMQARGDEEGAQEAMRMASGIADRFDASQIDDTMVGLYQARLDIQQGRVETAARWLEEAGTPNDTLPETPYYMWELGHLTLINHAIAQEDYHTALTLTADILPYTRIKGRHGIVIDVLTLQAVAYFHNDQLQEAMDALQQALTLAAPEKYIRTFVDKGDPVKRLLRKLQETSLPPDLRTYIENLITCFGPISQLLPSDQQRHAAMVEPLSYRELEVLRLIAEGCTNKQIADRLIIARSTVKTHINNIYGKLGVHSRTEAIELAQYLGLLER